MLPELVKKCEMSCPFSANLAIRSADAGFRGLRVLLINLLLLLCRSPECDQVVILTIGIFSYLKNKRVQPACDPADGALLLRNVQTLVKVKGMRENFPALLRIRCHVWGCS